jgi:hypothetical protein
MPTYNVTASVTISVTIEVDALDEEAARKVALALPLPTLCHQCSGLGVDLEDECWCVDELDGEPTIEYVREQK